MDAAASRKLMILELIVLGSVSIGALLVATTQLGATLFGGPLQAAKDLRPFGLVAAICIAAGVRLGFTLILDPEGLPRTGKTWWTLGWIGALAMAGVLGTWIYQALSGERMGIGPDDSAELNPFGGPARDYVQYQLRMAAFGIPLLLPWIHLLWARRVLTSGVRPHS